MMVTQRKWYLLAVCIGLSASLGSAIADIDPDAGDEAGISPGSVVAAVADSDCDTIGIFGNLFNGTNRYRGNVYRFEFNAKLKEIKMELQFALNEKADLHVAIHRKEANGEYKRYPQNTSEDIIIPNSDGTGLPFVYSTANAVPPMPEVILEAGYDYAIAFAWGSRDITYGRDTQLYPVDFRAGQVLGLVAAATLPPDPTHPDPDPLVPETFPAFQIFTGGAYSMQLCFKPETGACCSTDYPDGCREVLETECTGTGSFFHGEHTRCFDTPCIFGACCTRCGECLDGYTEGSCFLAADGAHHWADVSCPVIPAELCPPVTGACCRSNGNCDEMCEQLCAGVGVYRGDGTTCTPNYCKGACCRPGFACSNKTQASCTTFLGTYKGDGTSCATLPPNLECGGACCYGDTGLTDCLQVTQRALCTYDAFQFTAYRGDGLTCTNCGAIGDYRACCLPDGTCINTTSAACGAVGVNGEFDPVSRCEERPEGCLNVKACCLADGECSVLTEAGCTSHGGSRPANAPSFCGLSTCTTGACCSNSDPVCAKLTQAACTVEGGNYRGNGTNCSVPALVCPGIGACCRSNGDCFDNLMSAQCTIIGGDYEGNTTVCDAPSIDCDQRGACCAISGTCLFITQAQCQDPAIGGEFKGVGVLCAANTCPAGACCLPGGCEKRTQAGCPAPGDFLGVNVECAPDPCIVGACCKNGTCSRETRFACEHDLGVYKGDDTNCDGPNPCPCTSDDQCDDGNDCTNDVCSGGSCTHTNKSVGTACGSAADTECTNPDSCDDAGVCLANDKPADTNCGNAGTECRNQDKCNGAGACTDNGFKDANTNCGNAGTECRNQDKCNGAGTCTDNGFKAAGTVCRASTGACDPAEECDGVSGTCPTDSVITSCINSDGCCPSGCNNGNDNDCSTVTVLKWESVLTHGAVVGPVALDIPDTGLFSEPRSGIKKIVVTFDGAINPTTANPANVTVCGNDVTNSPVDLSGIVVTTATTTGDTKMEINFTHADLTPGGLPNFARYRIVINTNIQGAGGGSIQAGTGGLSRILTALQGDAAGGGDRRVNATDLGLVRGLVGTNPIDPGILNHLRSDANNDGRINATDLGLVRGRVGQDARAIVDPVCP